MVLAHRRKRTGGGEALDGVDVGGARQLEDGGILDVGQGRDDVEGGSWALGGVWRLGQPARQAAAAGRRRRVSSYTPLAHKAGTLATVPLLQASRTPKTRAAARNSAPVGADGDLPRC